MEKILIYRDEKAIESWKKQREVQNIEIMELGAMLREDNIELDQKTFMQFAKVGPEFIWTLLEKELEANAKKAGITSRIGKKNLKTGINERSKEYKPIRAKILAGFPKCQNKLEEITISQGKAILTKEELEKKRQELSIYIETADQLELWKILENVCKFLNAIEGFLKKRGLPSIFQGGSPDNLTDYIFWEKDPKIQLTESEARFGMSTTGGMIYKPDPDAIEYLKSKKQG